jgi:hypothetical protein
MNENDQERLFMQAQRSRRNFLAKGGRNVLAIGAIAAFATIARINIKPAAASTLPCFLRGTKIQTVAGERKVEDLAIGDLLPTVFEGERPIQWIGRYRYKKSDLRKPWVKDARPVRVGRSALAPDVPHTDLFLTRGHALFVDGALVPVGSLINGTTIALYAANEFDELEFFHIKLETHDVIHAEGAPCETLLTVSENANNFSDYFRRYGTPRTEDQPCVPILSYDGGRSEIKSRLRSAISPWFDCRRKIDVIRDRLEERAIALRRQMEAIS